MSVGEAIVTMVMCILIVLIVLLPLWILSMA